MDKLEIRMTRDQLGAVIDALAAAAAAAPHDPQVGRWNDLGTWLAHRYTRRWGLPASLAARAARRGRG